MCPDNLTEVSRQAPPLSRQEDGVRTISVHQVSGKAALKAYREKRKKDYENKENIPPVLHKEEAFYEGFYTSNSQRGVDQEAGHDDSGKHVPT